MIQRIGSVCITGLTTLGECIWMLGRLTRALFGSYRLTTRVITQLYLLGVKSLPITLITSVTIGLVFTFQIVQEFTRFGANYMIGGIVGLAFWRELAPLLISVAVSARSGAFIAAEIGTMRVTEQIDALKTLSADPLKILVLPRIIASMIMMPLLVGLADLVTFLSGFFVVITMGHVNPYSYFKSATLMLMPFDIVGGLIKALVFGFFMGFISCYQGLKAKAGAKGVGESTTRAVVMSLVFIFVLNYGLTLLLY